MIPLTETSDNRKINLNCAMSLHRRRYPRNDECVIDLFRVLFACSDIVWQYFISKSVFRYYILMNGISDPNTHTHIKQECFLSQFIMIIKCNESKTEHNGRQRQIDRRTVGNILEKHKINILQSGSI